MTRDLIKAAIRRRMAETGEPYCLARRRVLAQQHPTKRATKLGDAFAAQSATSVFQRQVQDLARLAAQATQMQTRSALQPAIIAHQQQVQDLARLAAHPTQFHTGQAAR